MILISGTWVEVEHVSAVAVVKKRTGIWRHRWEVLVHLVSGYGVYAWEKGSTSLAEAEHNRDRLALFINSEKMKVSEKR